jgi:hypothetical protein
MIGLAARVVAADDFPSYAGTFAIGSGLEGGGNGHAAGVRRARTSIRIGGVLGLEETPGPSIGAGLLVELEPHSSVGADLRYVHFLDERLSLHIGGVGIFAPSTLFGVTAGAEIRFRVSRRLSILVEPAVRTFFLGDDLAGNTIIWQGLLNAGMVIHIH